MCNFSSVNMKQEAPQAFRALMTEVTNLFSDLLYETLWGCSIWKKTHQPKTTNKKTPTTNPNKQTKKPNNSNLKKTTYLHVVFITNQNYQFKTTQSDSIKLLPSDTCMFQIAVESVKAYCNSAVKTSPRNAAEMWEGKWKDVKEHMWISNQSCSGLTWEHGELTHLGEGRISG